MYFLTINAGSSSIKFSLFAADASLQRTYEGSIEGIGFETATFNVTGPPEVDATAQTLTIADHDAALRVFLEWAAARIPHGSIAAIGHRIVHGGPTFSESCPIDESVVTELRKLTIFDPEHLPAQLKIIETLQQAFPGIPQIASFDTAFHHNLPTVARLLPIPRRYEARGIRRYGFHGLSYSYLMEELRAVAGEDAARGRIVLAHLGNGVSLAAVQYGTSIDTTMGLTPAGGVPMSTRSGDLDPGLASYLAQSEGLTVEQFNTLTGFQSGLLGISETTADMKQLLDIEHQDSRAADAIALFCYQIKKTIGAYAAALGGLDTLVFTGGMGEKAPKLRARICDGLGFLGVELDTARNESGAALISRDGGRVAVRVIHTDEALTIARDVLQILGQKTEA